MNVILIWLPYSNQNFSCQLQIRNRHAWIIKRLTREGYNIISEAFIINFTIDLTFANGLITIQRRFNAFSNDTTSIWNIYTDYSQALFNSRDDIKLARDICGMSRIYNEHRNNWRYLKRPFFLARV